MSLKDVCVLASRCKNAGLEGCNSFCFPYVLTHGQNGQGGVWAATGVPRKYLDRTADNLDMIQEQNPVAYQFAKKYLDNIMDQVNEGVGLYLYSIPNDLNRKGTGTGKSSVAATLVNEFVKLRVIEQAKGGRKIQTQPAIFLRVSEFQNVYNDQFRGSFDMQEAAAVKFGQMKRQMMNTELLVLDDIGLRDAKTLTNIIYEIIDHRNNEEKATVITSNVPVAMLGDLLSDQIASRIEEMCELVPFKGKDNRKKLL